MMKISVFTALKKAAHKRCYMETFKPTLHEDLYFSEKIEDVIEEAKRRKNDVMLRTKISLCLSLCGRPFVASDNDKVCAVLSRSISSPNREQLHFLELCDKYKLEPIILEYDSKFVTINKEKFYLARMLFADEGSIDNKNKLDIINIAENQGKMMSLIKTHNGESLLSFHRNIFDEQVSRDVNIIDFTDWFNETRYIKTYYYYFLLLFLQDAILFDNYILNEKSERSFTFEKILPSIYEIYEDFKIKPLVSPLISRDEETDLKWYSYPSNTKSVVERKIKR